MQVVFGDDFLQENHLVIATDCVKLRAYILLFRSGFYYIIYKTQVILNENQLER